MTSSIKYLLLRIEDVFFKNKWNPTTLAETRQKLNNLIDNGTEFIFVSSLSQNKVKEYIKNLVLLQNGYLISSNGAMVTDLSNNEVILENKFDQKLLKKLSSIVTRIDFDNLSDDIISIYRLNDSVSFFNNNSSLFYDIKEKYKENNSLFSEDGEFPINDDSIVRIEIKFCKTNINLEKITEHLKLNESDFTFNLIDEKTLEILPKNVSISDSINYLVKNKNLKKTFLKENVSSIGIYKMDNDLFEFSSLNFSYENAPYLLKKNAKFVFLGDISNLLIYASNKILDLKK